MVAWITLLVIEFILVCASAFGFVYPVVAWCVMCSMVVCAAIGGIILPGAIKGIKSKTPSRGQAIAKTAMAGTVIGIGVVISISMAFNLAFMSYLVEEFQQLFSQLH